MTPRVRRAIAKHYPSLLICPGRFGGPGRRLISAKFFEKGKPLKIMHSPGKLDSSTFFKLRKEKKEFARAARASRKKGSFSRKKRDSEARCFCFLIHSGSSATQLSRGSEAQKSGFGFEFHPAAFKFDPAAFKFDPHPCPLGASTLEMVSDF